ncbi:hypothetical protein LCGC14_2387970 [marine sediment metagenome]|uniref:Uncharacterized protein n=1 Tax=marine sediment metagenome TaxID=412755 RepID=A0A0F9ETK6_9ZZZZ
MVTLGTMKRDIVPLPGVEELRTTGELALARALEECLQAMEQGELDLDALAGRYPEVEEEIRPLLDIAQQLRQGAAAPPITVEFLEGLRAQLMSHKVTTRAS